jgi:hypothetical protein
LSENTFKVGNLASNSDDGTRQNYCVYSDVDIERVKKAQNSWLLSTVHEAIEVSVREGLPQAEVLDEIHFSSEHCHWKWDKKLLVSKAGVDPKYCFESFCLETPCGAQALMLVKYPHPKLNSGDHTVYVDYLQVAPWNYTNKFRETKRFRGVGLTMLGVAAEFAESMGNHLSPGFALHSLPQSRDFYLKIGMHDFGPDPSYLNLAYFELPEQLAEKFRI